MGDFARKAVVCLVSALAVVIAACGGGSTSGGGGGSNPSTPTVTVTPTANSITIADSVQVNVRVTGNSSTPTGTVTLSCGSYTSSAATLSAGTTTITVPAGKLAVGSNTLTASYAPASTSSATYTSSSGTALVAVTVVTPTVTVTPASLTIGAGQALSVTVAVAGASGGPVPTGSVTLTGANGSYRSGPTVLSAGSATISIPGGTLAVGSAKLTASFTPDGAGSAVYASGSGSATVTVTSQLTPTVRVIPALQSLATSSSLSVTVTVTGSGATPTGSVVLSGGTYHSSDTALSGGSATFTIPAYSLAHGTDALKASYTPDASSSATYTSQSASTTVSVAQATPAVTVTPASLSINTAQSLGVTVAVSGGAGAPVATGTISVTGGGYASPSPAALSAGSATITIGAGGLAAGTDTLTATYTPDTAGSTLFGLASGQSTAITVVTMSTISVNTGTSIGTVTDQLMGMNLAAWYDLVGNSTAINNAFAQAGIKAIRWPGGSWSDEWHWRTSPTNLLPFKCNNPGPGAGWGGSSSFADFVTSIAKGGKYDLALTANYGSNATCKGGGDPSEAATWAAEAVREGYPPSHMTVGNENYGSWEFDLHAKPWDAATYANSVIGTNGYYRLIRTASPMTKVGVVVDAGAIQSTWDSTVLSTAKGSYDFVEYHFYAKNPGQEDDAYLVHTAAQDLTANLNTVKAELHTAGNDGIPIYVGEMGSVSSNPGKQSWSITQGLYAGQTLGEMMNAGVVRATWWIGFGNCNGSLGSMSSSLYGWQTFGAYNVFSDGPGDLGPDNKPCGGAGPIGTMSPTARAFELFGNLAVTGEHVLGATINGDRINIRAYAATHSGGTALFLFNLNENQSQPVTVTLSGQAASSGVTVMTYDKSLYDQTNAASPVWAAPTTGDLGAQSLPLTLTLTPWSMNVVIIK